MASVIRSVLTIFLPLFLPFSITVVISLKPPDFANTSVAAAATLLNLSGVTATLSGSSIPSFSAISLPTCLPASTISAFSAASLSFILVPSLAFANVLVANSSALAAFSSTTFCDVSSNSSVCAFLLNAFVPYFLAKYKGTVDRTAGAAPEIIPVVIVCPKLKSSCSSTAIKLFCSATSWRTPAVASVATIVFIGFAAKPAIALPTPNLAVCCAATPASLPPPGSNNPSAVDGAVNIPPA